uniref:Uncharacterized protein n=1 Tax=Nelumbo nucifera TaxID=4432 RepID=A0A822YCK2_NELNU|nr:TPA_asm: hypothetical protein HUJ06_030264 [Nelumbo nucifera]
MDISSMNNLIYIDVGAGESIKSKIINDSLSFYPAQSRANNVYIVDHDTFVLSSYVKKPGITFVYHPGLDENKVTASRVRDLTPLSDDGFDFLVWFKGTVTAGDFVVLRMNARGIELL